MESPTTGADGAHVPHTGEITAEHQIAWLAVHREYRRLRALAEADEKFGALAAAKEAYEEAAAKLSHANGGGDSLRWPRPARDAMAAAGHAFDLAHTTHLIDYMNPCEAAAIALVTMPAPDLDAAIGKIAIVDAHELDQLTVFLGRSFAFIAADLARFAPGGAA